MREQKLLKKAKKLIKNSGNGKLPAKGSFKYIVSTPCDIETGELFECVDYYSIDEEKITKKRGKV